MSFAAMMHLTEGLCLSALPTPKVENSLFCLVGTGLPAVFMMEGKFILPLKP
jgi:hypothetical protein